MDTEVDFATVVDRHDIARQHVTDTCDHLDTDILTAFFDAVDGALAGAKRLGELSLGKATSQASLLDQVADFVAVFFNTHKGNYIINDINAIVYNKYS